VSAGFADLEHAIVHRRARLGVIGLGFVGTPVAALFADAGFDVVGVDVDADRVAAVNGGRMPFEGDEPGLGRLLEGVVSTGRLRASSDYDELRAADVVLIAVETPVEGADHKPRYAALRSALEALGAVLEPERLVIVESTLAPGTMSGLVGPTLERSCGLRDGRGMLLAHCPERVMPGRLLHNLKHTSRVIGGTTPRASVLAHALYRHVVEADLDMTDALTAEIVKTGENAYRDVQIAFANEVALLCEELGADVWEVRELINKSPGREMLRPGAGVGGHCIPKDPWLLVANAGNDVEPRLIPAARAVNDGMPAHVARVVERALGAQGLRLAGVARVAVLGYAYLEDTDDDRNSPSAVLVEALRQAGADVRVHDPWVERYRQPGLEETVRGSDAVVIMVAHSAYSELDLAALRSLVQTPVLVDCRGVIDRDAARAAGWTLWTIGVGAPAAEGAA
jgi:UDP-N-acetyl-D-mannosaminuronic acid dehydrogenase